ncbi:AfsR/SARP family transcriptional regulator [Streptomyces sp. NPDC019990]|uniref:AfsR/SARP family transcriptional regulator n=1 Tax=Streptomyces sp. NPDC019990 TaxID=3154693 RepID=UPI0033C96ECB
MRFFVLGPSEIKTGHHAVRPKGAVQELLFASFMATAGRLVTIDALAEELWGTTPPTKMHNALQAQISRLRRTLARAEQGGASRITTSVSGYQFNLEPGELDSQVFLDTVDIIRGSAYECMEKGIAELRSILALWRGPAFGGLAMGPLCLTAASKFEESRLSALELLYDLELKVGAHNRIIPEVTETLAQNPMQEQFCRQVMVALYRSGRQIDALNVYREFRQRLNVELGIEPSPMLKAYESAVLEHDLALLEDSSLGRPVGLRV